MAYSAPTKCSVCGSELQITRLTCPNCSSEITGTFAPCRYCSLDEKQKLFLDTFLKCRGNIKEVERTLSVSYPTVKNMLEDLLAALFPQDPPAPALPDTQEVLDLLEQKKITAQEAARLLSGK
ncbi:hypothetical protein CAFE_16310 [Caprobacter fermentans]|uniref:DUF2089 domain-containing protein n=1 Tax=Caproicibacter fermentans TaxID=2576756 RepID=A0A6N8HZH7_9FIRM|nr:DUF2089 domain-containing protein [Caproicibacter fermentans]MVB10930.1 hypothetical protein [Caproicibacter fermentans]OCN01634.1 hypothetical protein A7X67_00620 [Clostridium sp. W14A]